MLLLLLLLLLQVFTAFSGVENLPMEPKTMSLREWMELLESIKMSEDASGE